MEANNNNNINSCCMYGVINLHKTRENGKVNIYN